MVCPGMVQVPCPLTGPTRWPGSEVDKLRVDRPPQPDGADAGRPVARAASSRVHVSCVPVFLCPRARVTTAPPGQDRAGPRGAQGVVDHSGEALDPEGLLETVSDTGQPVVVRVDR